MLQDKRYGRNTMGVVRVGESEMTAKLISREPTKEQKKAYYLVRRAIDIGDLIRPDICRECGVKPAKGKDGRTTIEAHHYRGYEYPLSVQWLCVSCHRGKQTPTYPNGRPYVRGEINGAARLTNADVRNIKILLSRKEPFRRLARKFGVDKQTIKRIHRGETWAWLEAQ